MGFNLHLLVAPCAGDADALLAALRERLPRARARRISSPFDAVVAGYDPHRLWEEVEPEPARFGYADVDAAYEAVHGGVEAAALELSRAFPDRAFGFIEADCFGGVCLYAGSAARDGAVFFRTGAGTQSGHQDVLRTLGAAAPDWYFEPFTRGFFDGEAPPGPPRRPISASLRGEVRGMGVAGLYVHLTGELPAPWRVWVMGETLLVCHAEEDVFLSLNPSGDALTLGGRCHAPPCEAEALADTLVRLGLAELGLGYTLELRAFDGAPLRSWTSA